MGGEPCNHRGTPHAALVFRRLARAGEVDRLERGDQLGQVKLRILRPLTAPAYVWQRGFDVVVTLTA